MNSIRYVWLLLYSDNNKIFTTANVILSMFPCICDVDSIPNISRSYTLTGKLAVIASVKRGEWQANVSHGNGVPESTIRGWLRHEEKLCNFVKKADSPEWMKKKGPELPKTHNLTRRFSHRCEAEAARIPDYGYPSSFKNLFLKTFEVASQ